MASVMTAMSGGVDSSAAAYILKTQGHNTAGMIMRLWRNEGDTSVADAERTASSIGIPFFVTDLSEKFKKCVVEPFCRDYIAGDTPNPCVYCNKTIKFSAFADKASELGYENIATGHYARIEYDTGSGRWLLKRSADSEKDQTYMLYGLTQQQLARTMFPLGEYKKPQVRELAHDAKLPVADRPDSQDICFVPDGDYQSFITSFTGTAPESGDFVDTSGNKLGSHHGITGYTVGQRRGLGVSSDRRLYVIKKSLSDNTVVLGDEAELFYSKIRVRDVNLIALEKLDSPVRVEAKIRYSTKKSPATLYPDDGGALLVFDRPQRAPVRGQSAVFYDGDCVVGGGIIAGADK